MPNRNEERMAAGVAEEIAGQVAARSSGPVRAIALLVVAVLGIFLGGSYVTGGGILNTLFGGAATNTNNGTTNNGGFNGTNNNNTGVVNTPVPVSNGNYQFGIQLKTAGCRVNGPNPDSACTPGAIISTATVSQICVSGYSSSVRNVPTSEKDQVYQSYGIVSRTTGEYEVDHLVSLELGGSNDISNLWPEAASPTPGFHQKDQVENYLHAQVCANKISLHDAQVEIATNWLAVWKQMGN